MLFSSFWKIDLTLSLPSFDLAIRDMTGNPCPLFFKICIKYVSPALMIVLLVWLMIDSILKVETYEAFVNCNPVR